MDAGDFWRNYRMQEARQDGMMMITLMMVMIVRRAAFARRCQVVAPKPVFWTANVIERQKVTQPTITTNRREESAL